MSVTELPKLGQPRIPNGTFVIFSFDPVTYASEIDPEDDILSAAAGRIKRKKYLGLVQGLGPMDLPKLRQNYNIRLVGLAPPQVGEDDVYPTNPSRCVPVHSTTSHPEGRQPLVPPAPLPWSECYVHTLQLVNAFVSRVHHCDASRVTIGKDELQRLAQFVVHDQYAANDERRALEPDRDEADSDSDDESYCSSDDEYDSDSEVSEFCDPAALAPSSPYIEIWEDLGVAVASTLGEPKNVGADVDEVMELGQEWQERKKQERRASSPQTLKWVAQVAVEQQVEPESEDKVESEACALEVGGCDELGPEDAVDEPRKIVKYSHEGGAPSESSVSTESPSVEFSEDVCDKGPGVSLMMILKRWMQLALRL